MIEVEVVLALPRSARSVRLRLPDAATVGQAATASALPMAGIAGYAVHGERVPPSAALRDGDRVELLRPLTLDPKEARRRRAGERQRR